LMLGIMVVWMSCVDKVDLSLPAEELPLIIEGQITDQPGPHTVKISRAYPVDGNYYSREGVEGAQVTITDNAGNVDVLQDISGGSYVTQVMNGVVGRTYQLEVKLGGTTFQSTPQLMAPAGSIDSIYFEHITTVNNDKDIEEEGFNIYVNGSVDPSSSRRMRWKYDGTYKIFTNPAAITNVLPCAAPPCPIVTLPCAEDCSCCTCYVYERETSPLVSNPTTLGANQFNHVFIHYLPINGLTFNEKYRVEITQMELSQDVFDFYAAVSKQIDNASSLFQPPFFELKGNVNAVVGDDKVVGIFYAAALSKKHIYILRSDIPGSFITYEIAGDCRAVAENSTTVRPPFWE
jgi:hypothetical protein